MDERYYIRFKGRVLGPMSKDKTVELIRRGQISRMHELSPDGLTWRPAEDFAELFPQKVESAHIVHSNQADVPVAQQADQWYAHIDGQNIGPIDEENLRLLAASGRLLHSTLVWKNGMQEWLAAQIVRPNWFAGSNSSTAASTNTNTNTIQTDDAIAEICVATSKRSFWVYLISVCGIIGCGLLLMLFLFSLVAQVVAPDESGNVAVAGLVLTFIVLLVLGFVEFCFVALLRYANSISLLRHMQTTDGLREAARRLSVFWHLSGIMVLCSLALSLSFILFMVAIGARWSYLLRNFS